MWYRLLPNPDPANSIELYAAAMPDKTLVSQTTDQLLVGLGRLSWASLHVSSASVKCVHGNYASTLNFTSRLLA